MRERSHMRVMHEDDHRSWDAVSPSWQEHVAATIDWRKSATDPRIALSDRELALMGDVSGKPVCVLGSGDNLVAFALAGLGAQVTSVDISQVQLDIAQARATQLGLSIAFVRQDITDLSDVPEDTFDLVYTGGHVAVWVADLRRYYAEAVRILRPGGMFMVNEYHPFRRIWEYEPGPPKMAFDYFERGPHRYDRSDDIPGACPGQYPSHEFSWTVSDYLSAMLEAGCELVCVDEFGEGREPWEPADLSGLPLNLLFAGRKRPPS